MNRHASPAPRRGALLDELDSLRFSGIPERNEEEDVLDRETEERVSGETRWQVRSLTEVPPSVETAAETADLDDDMDEETLPEESASLPPQMRRRLEREAAAEDAPRIESFQEEQVQKLRKKRASTS